MVQTYLNENEESERWKEQLRFVDLLVWSIEPKKTEEDKKRLANILIELLITLQDGLKSIDIEQSEMDLLLAALENCHMASMRGEHRNTAETNIRIKLDTASSPISKEMDEIDIALAEMQTQLNKMNKLEQMLNIPILDIDDAVTMTQIHGNSTVNNSDEGLDVEEITITSGVLHGKIEPLIDDDFWQQTLSLQTGQWLNLQNENGKNQRLRLVWKSDYLGECTFTNWKFKVVAELSFNELAARFRRGEASLIEALPLFERAINTMMNTLHQRSASAAG